MLPAEDPRWMTLKGGYRTPLDPRPLVKRVETEPDNREAWNDLWNELHHQGDVGDASYAAVPLIVETQRKRAVTDWDPYAIIATIDLARTKRQNPELPTWLSEEYAGAIQELAAIGLRQLPTVDDKDTFRAILSVIALTRGLRVHAKFLIEYTEDELREFSKNHRTQ